MSSLSPPPAPPPIGIIFTTSLSPNMSSRQTEPFGRARVNGSIPVNIFIDKHDGEKYWVHEVHSCKPPKLYTHAGGQSFKDRDGNVVELHNIVTFPPKLRTKRRLFPPVCVGCMPTDISDKDLGLFCITYGIVNHHTKEDRRSEDSDSDSDCHVYWS